MQFSIICTCDTIMPDDFLYELGASWQALEDENERALARVADKELDRVIADWFKSVEFDSSDREIEKFDTGRWLVSHKWCGILDKKQFEDFVEHFGLYCDSVETGGSIGAPGYFPYWAPAICFRTDCGIFLSGLHIEVVAYVTPIPNPVRSDGYTERDFYRIKNVLLSAYGF